MTNSVFFPQSLLDVLVGVGKLDLDGEELVVTDGGFRYSVSEALRITQEVTTGEDPHGLCGKVSSPEALAEKLGAEILGNSMLVEDNAYDVVPGMLGTPTPADAEASAEAMAREIELLTALQNIEDL